MSSRSDAKRKTRIFAKPAPGRTVPLEDGGTWPEAGNDVPLSRYYRRRLADDDIVEAPRPRQEAKSAGGATGNSQDKKPTEAKAAGGDKKES